MIYIMEESEEVIAYYRCSPSIFLEELRIQQTLYLDCWHSIYD
jgi:hypothetical protein